MRASLAAIARSALVFLCVLGSGHIHDRAYRWKWCFGRDTSHWDLSFVHCIVHTKDYSISWLAIYDSFKSVVSQLVKGDRSLTNFTLLVLTT